MSYLSDKYYKITKRLIKIAKKRNYCLIMKLKLEDLVPQKAAFKLSTLDNEITLRPWSLRVRFWALEKYGQERLQEILQTQSLKELCDIVFYMLSDEDKKRFKSFDDFLDSVQTTQDILNLSMALLGTIGLSEPVIEQIRKEMHANEVPKTTAPAEKKSRKK